MLRLGLQLSRLRQADGRLIVTLPASEVRPFLFYLITCASYVPDAALELLQARLEARGAGAARPDLEAFRGKLVQSQLARPCLPAR
jgi:hypothetical protein